MHAILYRSLTRPGRPFLASDLNDIVEAAERNNPRLGVTGLLLYAEMEVIPGVPGSVLQWIEGPQEAVESLFEAIRRDPRHTSVEALARGPVGELAARGRRSPREVPDRLFPTWTMGLVRLSELPATLPGFLDYAGEWEDQPVPRAA